MPSGKEPLDGKTWLASTVINSDPRFRHSSFNHISSHPIPSYPEDISTADGNNLLP